MTKKLIILTITLLFAVLLPNSLLAQTDEQTNTGAAALAMPDNDNKFRALENYIRKQTNTDTLLYYTEKQLQLAKKLDKREFISRALMNRGYAYGRIYDYKQAVEAYQKALKIAEEDFDRLKAANCYNEMAVLLTRTNDYNKASEYFNNALHIYIEISDTLKITDVYRNMGRQCLSFHLYKTAKSYFDNAFRLDSISGDPKSLGLDFYNAGKSDYLQFLDLDSLELLYSGINNIKKSLTFIKKTGNKRMLQGCYEQLMLMYVSMYTTGKQSLYKIARDSAHYYHKLTNAIRMELNPTSEHIVVEITSANLLTMDGKYAEAIKDLKNLEKKFDRAGSKYTRYRAFLYRSMIWTFREAGDYKGAVDYSEKFKIAEESTYNREFAVKSIKASAETEYSEIIRKREASDRKQELAQREQIKQQRTLTTFFIISIVLAAIFVVVIWKSLKRKRHNNELLAKQKSQILQKNNELQIQNQKIESQRDEILAQRDEIEAQKTQLADANSRITASIRYAQRIQTASVPSTDMMQKIFGEFMVYWKPLNIVSGDFFWATQAGRYKLITAADCTGHGVPGAFMSMLGVSTLNDIAAQKDIEGAEMTAAAILEELRSKIIAALRQSGPQRENQDGIEMAFCIIDTQKQEIQFAGANRPLWLVRDGVLTEYKPDRMYVGDHIKNNAPFSNTIIPIQKGDTIYMSSDGIQDQFGGSGNKPKFGAQKLRDLLESIASKPLSEQYNIIESTMDDWRRRPDSDEPEPQLDDQILVGIRI
ncbi:MAG: SpoIIE family protein phosphatase [Bacteroidales bacterium]|nr:SpoIIE family protein phosphatase [Bacteroidales bacterium]